MDLNAVDFPEEFVKTASEWYGGQDCILYAVSSTGGLTRGSIRPVLCDDDGEYRPATDQAWIRHLWDQLDSTLSRNIRNLLKRPKGQRKGLRSLQAFHRWVGGVLAVADAALEAPNSVYGERTILVSGRVVPTIELTGEFYVVSGRSTYGPYSDDDKRFSNR